MQTPSPDGLTAFQVEVARVFFFSPAADGFVLAGGAALIAQGLSSRPTRDLDFFTRSASGSVPEAVAAFERAAHDRGWRTVHVRDSATFCRLIVHGPEHLLVDVAVDSPPTQPPEMTVVGPTLAPAELAGRKLLALFGRAEARDFADVYLLAQRFGTPELLAQSRAVDAGLEEGVLADMLGSLRRFSDEEIPIDVDAVRDLRDFFAQWQEELRADAAGGEH